MKLISQSKPYPTSRYIEGAPIYHLDDTLAHAVVKTMMAICYYRFERRLAKIKGSVSFDDAVKYAGVRTIKHGAKRKTGARAHWGVVSISPVISTETDQMSMGLMHFLRKHGFLKCSPIGVFSDHALARLLQRHVRRASSEELLDAVAIVGEDLYEYIVKNINSSHCIAGDFKVETRIGTLCCTRTNERIKVKTFFKE